MKRRHSMPFGVEIQPDGAFRFRLWAPGARRVDLCLEAAPKEIILPMKRDNNGWYSLVTDHAQAGARYRYGIDGEQRVPDPVSRYQPNDIHGPSEVIDPAACEWKDSEWHGRPWEEVVLYELHVGTFSEAGNYAGVIQRLDELVDLGVTAIELMPLADFPGRRNWGYDGVFLFSPDSRYGRPEELKELVQCAHQRGLMMFLDVVYNHFGPEGNYLHGYAPSFFTDRHHAPWGAAINYDGTDSRTVRDFFIHNALYWLEEYHFDGLRLDAVHAIVDDTRPDILQEIARAVMAGPGASRQIHLVLENDNNATKYLERDSAMQPCAYVAQWNDDIHHVLHVMTTGERSGYYEDYADTPARHLGRCLTEGFAYQGEPSRYRHGAPRGESCRELPPTAFVSFLQNHDQIGNRAMGERITELASVEALRAATAILLLAPSPPMIFMGQEWSEQHPFLFFCDFGPELAGAVTEGRRKEFARFPEFSDAKARARIPDPNDEQTFIRSCLDWAASRSGKPRAWRQFHKDLLALRARDIVPRLRGLRSGDANFEVLNATALRVHWQLGDGSHLTLLANLSENPSITLSKPTGRLLYAVPSEPGPINDHIQLPPWSVLWYWELSQERKSG
jgi:malto-oligosyltrehalose trehalohydrolase